MSPKGKRMISPYRVGFQKGRTDGFNRGREAGYAQGRQDSGVAVPPRPVPIQTNPDLLDALVITPGVIPSLEIGIKQPLDHIVSQGALQYEIIMENEVSRERIAHSDIIIFQRNVEPEYYRLLEWAHELGKRTVYVIDDNFLAIPPTSPTGLYYNDPNRSKTFVNYLKYAQKVKVDSSYFGDYIVKNFNSNVVYFPASVDFGLIDPIQKPAREDGQVLIGYEGGSKDPDFVPVVQAIKRIIEEYGGFVRFEFMGYVPSELADHPSVSAIEFQSDYRSFIQRLKQCTWDIGLAPLEDNKFNYCKTNNKFREYAACGIPGIYSALPVYTEWVRHGETGYLVSHTADAWYEGLKEMIENPALRGAIRMQADDVSRQHFTLEECSENWLKSILK